MNKEKTLCLFAYILQVCTAGILHTMSASALVKENNNNNK